MFSKASFFDKAKQILDNRWRAIKKLSEIEDFGIGIPSDIRQAISSSVNSRTKSYRYVLPAQILAKLTDSLLDCRCVQEGSGRKGSFDARSFCRKTIVEFDRENDNVLGGSGDPYVNNPLRIPAITVEHRSAQKDSEGFDKLCLVLEFVEENPKVVCKIFDLVLQAVWGRLQKVSIVYPVPNRVSLEQVQDLLGKFLQERTGGVRLQCISVALFQTIGECFHLFHQVLARRVNVADSQTGSAADLECLSARGEVVLAVEVKDRQLTLIDMQDKLQTAREMGIRALIYLVRGGVRSHDAEQVAETSRREFSAGQNVYVCEYENFLNSVLILFQEQGRRRMLQFIGKQLNEHADLTHRQAWRDFLCSI